MTKQSDPLFDPEPTIPPAPSIVFPKTLADSQRDERPSDTGAGLEEVDPRDLRLPRLKLRQPLTPDAESVPEGSWFLTSDPAFHSLGREVVVLDVKKERGLMLPFGQPEAEAVVCRIKEKTGVEVAPGLDGPVCYSPDRVHPVALHGRTPLAESCATCPMNRWRTERGRRSQDCPEAFRLVVLDLLTQRPCVLFARGSSVRPTRELLATLRTLCEKHQRPAYAFALFVLSKRVEGTGGPYFVPVFHTPYLLDDQSQVAFHAALRRRLASTGAEEAA